MIIETESVVGAPIDQVWQRVISPQGINHEMRPWMTMSMPRGTEGLTIDAVPVGVPLGRAWIRLFGVVPFDYDQLMIKGFTEGRSFHESSTMLSMRRWDHERFLTPLDDGRTGVRDRVTFIPRLPLKVLTPVLARVLKAFFAHRHRRLRQYFD